MGRMVAIDGVKDGLYQLNLEEERLLSINLGIKALLDIWHTRLSHANERLTKEAIRDFALPVSTKNMKKCESCIIGKIHQDTYHSRLNKSLSPLDLVFVDVWGPTLVILAFGCRYYVLFVDGTTCYNWLFSIK